MGACKGCRGAKVKCEQVFPCARCQRLGIECIPHISKQGQRRKRARTKEEEQQQEEEDTTPTGNCPSTCAKVCQLQLAADKALNSEGKASEDAFIAAQVLGNVHQEQQAEVPPSQHYGLQVLVREWIALAIKRRSFQLWARAGTLAAQCGMNMDDILCETGSNHRGMDYLYQFILTPSAQQVVVGPALVPEVDIPMEMWESLGIQLDPQDDLPCAMAGALENRWIFGRETNKGIVRFYVSPGFERNVCTLQLIEETYRKNEIEVSSLFHVKEPGSNSNDTDFIRDLAQHIAFHKRPGLKSKPSKHSNVKIRVNKVNTGANSQDPNQGTANPVLTGEKETILADLVIAHSLPNLDCLISVCEFIPPLHRRGHEVDLEQVVDDTTNLLDGLFFDADKMNVEDGDEDFKLIYNLLKNS